MSAAPAMDAAGARRGLAGVPGLLLAFAGGAAAAIAHPPFGVWPGLAGFALLLHLLDAAPAARPMRAAFARGWAAGFAYFLVGVWWVGEAFMVDVEAHGWQAPFAVVLLPAGLALFWGAAGAAYRLLSPAAPRRILVFAAVFGLAEWVRGHVLTGFPWNLPGTAWAAGSPPSQAAAVLGAYGLSVVTLAIAAAPVLLAGPGGRRARLAWGAAAAMALAGLWIGGAARLQGASGADTGLRVRVVQPDIPQSVKWTPDSFRDIVERYVALTAAPAEAPIDAVIWPEAALPAPADELFAPGTWTHEAIAGALPPGRILLAGAYRVEAGPDGPRYFNSLMAFRREPDGALNRLATYDKHRLVPFGEYLPLQPMLARLGLDQLAAVGEGFTPGPPPAPIEPEGLPRLQPLVCYESLFPGFVGAEGGRPAWIVNVSNDAWFGRTSGPWQHLNLASYRAIEEGVPIVRATPTGVSAVVDAYGRPRARLGLGESGVIDANLPAPLISTPFVRSKGAAYWLLLMSGLACTRRPRFQMGKFVQRTRS